MPLELNRRARALRLSPHQRSASGPTKAHQALPARQRRQAKSRASLRQLSGQRKSLSQSKPHRALSMKPPSPLQRSFPSHVSSRSTAPRYRSTPSIHLLHESRPTHTPMREAVQALSSSAVSTRLTAQSPATCSATTISTSRSPLTLLAAAGGPLFAGAPGTALFR